MNLIHDEPPLLTERAGHVGLIRLNRPKAINSLTLEMVRRMHDALNRFEEDPDVAAVLVTGEGERGLCAGGDIRALYESARNGTDLAQTFWREEYLLNSRISRFTKPYIVIIDGITMGGGVGISAHGSHRIVTERTRIAMPETGIGYFPDVGATWLLSRPGSEFGTYLGLTGQQIGASDAIAAGLADYFVPADQLRQLTDALTAITADNAGDKLEQIIKRHSQSPTPSDLHANLAAIERTFAYDTVEQILDKLRADGSAFAQNTRSVLFTKSPVSLKLSLRLLRLGRESVNLEQCLEREFAGSVRILTTPDFLEGIRAAVIDKDRNPQWSLSGLTKVSDAAIEAFLQSPRAPVFSLTL